MEKSQRNATNVTIPDLIQAPWVNIWKYTAEKSQTNATNVTIPDLIQALFFINVHALSALDRDMDVYVTNLGNKGQNLVHTHKQLLHCIALQ